MSAYMQMGHNTENLVGIDDAPFKGIILSPVNRFPNELENDIKKFREKGEYDIIFDPQLYQPRSQREKLNDYSYFPQDIDTADLTSEKWWENLIKLLSDYIINLKIDKICTPAFLPNVYNNSYYENNSYLGQTTKEILKDKGIDILQTIIVDANSLTDETNRMTWASIASNNDTDGYYLILVSDTEPRREIDNTEALYNTMCFINDLESTNKPVLISN